MTVYQSRVVIEFSCPYDVNVFDGVKLSKFEIPGLQKVTQFALAEHVSTCFARSNLVCSSIESTLSRFDHSTYQLYIDIDTIRCFNDEAIQRASQEITDIAHEKLTVIDIATVVNIDVLSCAVSISEKADR